MNTDPHAKPMRSAFREIVTDSIRYWEVRRIAYNLVLAAVAVVAHVTTPENARQAITPGAIAGVIILAVIANLLYCAAYLPDIAMQYSAYGAVWRKLRLGLLVFGTFFAGLLTFLCVAPLRF